MSDVTTPLIGTFFPVGEIVHRDAIHIAVLPAFATETMSPGQHVGYADGKALSLENGAVVKAIGIIDPYLPRPVQAGDRMFIFLYPGSISSLRHEWRHEIVDMFTPSTVSAFQTITGDEHKHKSQEWIQNHADELGIDVDEMIGGAASFLHGGHFTVQEGSENWRSDFNATEFWHHYEVLKGKHVPEEKRRSFFCCTC